MDWVRPGFVLYGANPFSEPEFAVKELKPAMEFTSAVIAVREIASGEAVGYNQAWRAARDTRVAVVAVGYGDGYPRNTANGTPVLVAGQRAHTVGHVAMDMMLVDITDLAGVDVAEDRAENIRRIGEIAKLFCDTGVITLSSFVSPYRGDRDLVRQLHEEAGIAFIEVYMKTSLAEAEKRDPKGLYKKARAGEIKNFTGIDDPYEEPESPELVLDTEQLSLEQEVEALIQYLNDSGVLSA
eukprot:g4519.t1